MNTEAKKEGVESSFEIELTKIQFDLHLYISKLCGSLQDSQDILQDVNLQLCRRRDEYDSERGTLMAWAVTLAKLEVLHWRDRRKGEKLEFSSEWMDEVADTLAEEPEPPVDRRLKYLDGCCRKLSPSLADLLAAHHVRHESLDSIARRLKRTPHSIANSLYVIRVALRKCIEAKMRQEGKQP